ncbi:hypothetical protein E0K83_06685, partial [Gramella sp. BOM4]|nr:hypothetical protein [Christiangramia bathymodioli]
MSISKLLPNSFAASFLLLVFVLSAEVSAQSFSQNSIDFNGFETVNNGTSIMYGPDGRLYITEYTGAIKIYTIERTGPGSYVVQDLEVLTDIYNIQDHNDDGSLYSSTFRETIGITVTGTATNPVFYVTSSDFRIGGGGGGGSGDQNLDTNSGIITRFSWNGTTWDVVDIVRGLPRSEENHATNGLEFVTVNGIDYLIVAQGGHTNAGAPSQNFAYTTEYALSAAVLSINLTQLEAMPILDDNGRKYIYDIPTVDDPSRPNVNGIIDPDVPGYDGNDVNDPWGGNDGLNQAMIVPGGPVQIFSPGYRNAYDLVVTESGAVYVTDNGANGGWGGFPVNEGSGLATNDYDPAEPGSSTAIDGEQVNNKDHLSLVTTDIQNYTFGSFYGGHPTPIRANPSAAGLYTNPSVTGTTGAIFRTLKYHPTKVEAGYTQDPNLGLPANWPPVPVANPVEGDWRGPDMNNPDGPNDAVVTSWGTNTNAIDEYTASNFEGAMKGNLLAGVNNGNIRRVELNADGSLKTLTSSFFSGLGGNALGVTCNSDTDIFPGTIWVVTLEGILTVMEPQDFGDCILPGEEGYDALADYDFDGYSNQDEQDNGTDACNGGSQPQDFDKAAGGALISDINDLDDDSDGIQDKDDPFQLGDFTKTGSDAFSIPVTNELFSSNTQLKGYLGLGMTGLMNNGDANPNWLNWIDRRDDPADPNPNDILGGAIGAMTMQMTSGTAYGTTNTQEKAFQYGVQTDLTTGVFTVAGGIFNFSAPLQLYGNTSAPNGELGFFIGDGTQSNYIKFIISPQGLVAQQEIMDVPETPIILNLALEERPSAGVNFYFEVDPATGIISLEFSLDDGPRQDLGSITAKGTILEAIQQNTRDLAVGFIGTSNAEGVEVEGTWDFLNVNSSKPGLLTNLPDIERTTSSPQDVINLEEYFFDDQGAANLVYTVQSNSDPSIVATISGSVLNLSYPSTPAVSDITIRATDPDNNFVEDSFTVTVNQAPSVLYRVNAGGIVVASIDEEMDWTTDSSVSPSPYLSEPGTGGIYNGTIVSLSGEVDGSTTPLEIFKNERYDGSAGIPNLTYTFPVAQEGNYEVRLYMGNGWSGTSEPGTRIFDVAIEGVVHPTLNDIDLSARFGHQVGGVISQVVNITDGAIDISFIHGVQNPLVNGIEILSYFGSIETPITVAAILDQTNYVNDALDGSLAVSASGGDGNLNYSMEGAPAGVSIEPTNGQIGGTIAPDADLLSPYTVTVYVNDSDGTSSDEVSVTFQWFINGTEPIVSEEIPDLVRSVGSSEEEIDLHNYFSDNLGTENLIYTIEQNTDPSIGATISGNVLALTFPNIPATTSITIRATDSDNNFVEDTFQVTVNSLPLVLYRVNAGGPTITSIDSEINWAADNLTSPSIYLSEPGTGSVYNGTIINYTAEVDQESVPTSIFNSERYDNIPGIPNLTYSFPVTVPGNYEIRLYMGNGYSGTSQPGTRLFDVSIENIIYSNLDDLDLSATFGHQTGGMISYIVNVTDGFIDISFIHEKENPVINAIEIINALDSPLPIQVWEIADQINYRGEELDGSLAVQASGGDGTLTYSLEGAPPGVSINSTTGVITGTISPDADFTIPYQVKVIVDDNDSDLTDFAERSFFWTITESAPLAWIDKDESENYTGRHECSFVQAGDKFYLVGGRESAKTLDIYDYTSNTWTSLIDSAPFEFNHYQATEYQGLIWVIGAFKTNGFPDEIPADYIWAFDPANQEWIQVTEIPVDRRRGSAGLVMYNDKFYITGGNNLGHNGGYVSWFDEYDPKTGVWTSLADAPRARDHFHAAVIGDKMYLAGGRLSGGTGGTFKPLIPEIDVYDFTTSSWSTLPVDKNIPTPRAAASAVNFKGKLVVIGGEVDNEVIDGATVSDALKITEEYDPITGNWNRLADLNYERHGTQAIVSGDGIFTLAGSPNRGGGSQKNMEYLGEDSPVGSPSVASSLTGPENLSLLAGSEGEIQLEILNGNVGLIITSAVISGPNAENFQIISGNISGTLWKPNSTNKINVSHLGNQASESATLTINYGLNGQFTINLETIEGIVLDPIPDQTNSLGDQLDGSLIASASGGEGELNYTMTGAPAGVVIDPVTGIISGSINADAVNGSPYTVNISVDDADLTDTDAVNTSFTWTVLPGEPIVVQTIGDIEVFTNEPGIDFDLNNYFADNNGTENLVYSVTENTDPSISANITGSTLNITFPSTPAVSQITVRATDEFGNFNEISFQVSVLEDPNLAPVVSITAPVDGARFIAPGDILITADASDTDGVITQVEFLEGTNSLGIDTDGSDGWSVSWTGVWAGSYTLTAVATDDDLTSSTSEIVTITVEDPNVLPTISITSPLNNDTFTAPAEILITADAADSDGAISQVEFFEGTNSLGVDTDGSDGWSVNWTGVSASNYKLTAIATDDDLESTTSEIVSITVEDPNVLPTVVITSPLETDSFTAPADILITADASDADGSIAQVEFFEGANSLGVDTDSSDGWSFSWTGVVSGSYGLTAVATDNEGGSTTSSVINNALPTVTITYPLETDSFTAPADILITADASDADGSITQVEFFEGANSLGVDTDGSDGWSLNWTGVGSGSYALTAVATDNEGGSTASSVINIGVDNALPTVTITSPLETDNFTAPADILITADANDADGRITQVEFFEGTTSLGIDTDGSDGWSVNWTGVGAGSYALTAVATDNEGGSTASSVINIGVDNALPTVTITSPLETDNFTAPADIVITADASDADGSITQVEFFEGVNSLGVDTDSSDGWSFSWNGVGSGSYGLTAVATDNEGGSTTSSVVNIGVDNALPTVTIISPLETDNFTAPADIVITADASDADGGITQVEFFEGANSLGVDTDSSDGWSFSWTGVVSGSYGLTAVATDNEGGSTTSSVI